MTPTTKKLKKSSLPAEKPDITIEEATFQSLLERISTGGESGFKEKIAYFEGRLKGFEAQVSSLQEKFSSIDTSLAEQATKLDKKFKHFDKQVIDLVGKTSALNNSTKRIDNWMGVVVIVLLVGFAAFMASLAGMVMSEIKYRFDYQQNISSRLGAQDKLLREHADTISSLKTTSDSQAQLIDQQDVEIQDLISKEQQAVASTPKTK